MTIRSAPSAGDPRGRDAQLTAFVCMVLALTAALSALALEPARWAGSEADGAALHPERLEWLALYRGVLLRAGLGLAAVGGLALLTQRAGHGLWRGVRRALGKLGVAAAALVLGLLAAELVLRAAGRAPAPASRDVASVDPARAQLPGPVASTADELLRVLVIGDGFVLPTAADEGLARRLERVLPGPLGGRPVRAFTAGAPGADLDLHAVHAATALPAVRPGLVVLAHAFDDIESPADRAAFAERRRLLPVIGEPWRTRSALWAAVERALAPRLAAWRGADDHLAHLAARHADELGTHLAPLTALLRDARDVGALTVVLLVPPAGLAADRAPLVSAVHERLTAFLGPAGVWCLDLAAAPPAASADLRERAATALAAAPRLAERLAREAPSPPRSDAAEPPPDPDDAR